MTGIHGKKYRDAKVKIAASDENGIGKLEYAIVKNGEEPLEMTVGDKVKVDYDVEWQFGEIEKVSL